MARGEALLSMWEKVCESVDVIVHNGVPLHCVRICIDMMASNVSPRRACQLSREPIAPPLERAPLWARVLLLPSSEISYSAWNAELGAVHVRRGEEDESGVGYADDAILFLCEQFAGYEPRSGLEDRYAVRELKADAEILMDVVE